MRDLGGFYRVSVVYHQGSGRGKGLSRAEQLCDRLDSLAHEIRMLDISLISEEHLDQSLRSSDAVIAIGGDGLIHSILPALVDLGIPMGIIPAGSGNDAWRMSGACSVQQSMDQVVRFVQGRGRIRACDLLEVVFEKQAEQTQYVLGAVSCGFEAVVNAKANDLPRWLSASRYVLALFLSIPKLRGRSINIDAGPFQFSGKVLVGSISNIRSLGGGINLFPLAQDDDGLADLLLVHEKPLVKLLPYVGRILRGAQQPYGQSTQLTSANVQFEGTSYGDGEPLGTGNFALTVRPGALSLIDLRADGTR